MLMRRRRWSARSQCRWPQCPRTFSRATDFARDHPKFRLPSADRSKLKFNHTLHLDPAGVRRAGGARQVLNCERCHQSAEGGARMAPIVMEQHCRECHALTFDPQVSARQVPHGEVEDIETMLREFYARLLLGDMPPGVTPPAGLPRVRPGVVLTGAERTAAMKIADERARRALDELMQARAVCSTCHYTSRGKDGHWRVAPVELTEVWLPRSTFTHAKHSAQTCTSCHDVRASRRAEDLAMPDIASCRQCHGGGAAGQGRIASDCATCHRFHRAGS